MALGFAPATSDPLPYLRGLSRLVPERRLAAILSRCGRASKRRRRLPAESVVWLVIAMALFAADSVPKVWRRLHPTRDEPEPDDSAFTQARRRLGVAPLRRLFLETARPMATHQTLGAYYRGWRLMGLDGTTLDMPDTPENRARFIATIPLGRLSRASDVAAVALFLASDSAEFITGLEVPVDGGRTV